MTAASDCDLGHTRLRSDLYHPVMPATYTLIATRQGAEVMRQRFHRKEHASRVVADVLANPLYLDCEIKLFQGTDVVLISTGPAPSSRAAI